MAEFPWIRKEREHREMMEYQTLVWDAVESGGQTPPPADKRQYDWLIGRFPLRGVPFAPHMRALERIGKQIAPEPEPFSVDWRQSFIATMDSDPEFAEAVRLRLEVPANA